MHIEQLLAAGESKTLEFKQDASSLLPIIKSLIAFANTAGGIILIGVTDKREVLGVQSPDFLRDKITSSIADSIFPQLLADISVVTYEEKPVLAIQVEFGGGVYFLKAEGSEKGAYVRLGATNRVASPETLAEIRRQTSRLHYDAEPCLNARLADLDADLLQQYFDRINQPNTVKNQQSLGIVTQLGKCLQPTNAGIILFGQKQKRTELFPNTRIGCARFKGLTKADFIDKQDIDVDLLSAVDFTQQFIKRHTLNRVYFEGMVRKEVPEYPDIAIREVLINAIIHANYEVCGSRFLIAIFDDRIEIQNPGILLPGMTLDYLKAGISRIRNTVITRIFREAGMVEEWGSCYERVIAACKTSHCLEPTWEELGSVFRVTFYAGSNQDMIPETDHDGIMMGSCQEILPILAYARLPRNLADLMALVGAKHRVKFAAKYIHPLIEAGLLSMTLPNKPKSRLQRYLTTPKGETFLKERGKP